MDENKRWDAFSDTGSASSREKAREHRSWRAVEASYAQDITDEFVGPSSSVDASGGARGVSDGDAPVFFFNFRADRVRQIPGSHPERLRGFDRPPFRASALRACSV